MHSLLSVQYKEYTSHSPYIADNESNIINKLVVKNEMAMGAMTPVVIDTLTTLRYN